MLELAETTHAGHARVIAAEAVARGVGVVVAAGGDGTVAEVAAGVSGSGATLGLLPLGTANVLAHELGLPLGPELAAAILLGGRRVTLRPGLARWADGTERLFVQMIGAGFDAAVVHALDPAEKRRLGRGAYLLESARQLRAYGFPPFTVAADDGPPLPATSVIISKGRFYAGAFRALRGASPLHAGFSVLRFPDTGAWGAMFAGLSLPFHALHRVPGAVLSRAGDVRLAGNGIPCQADGDPAGGLPMEARDAPDPIPFLVA